MSNVPQAVDNGQYGASIINHLLLQSSIFLSLLWNFSSFLLNKWNYLRRIMKTGKKTTSYTRGFRAVAFGTFPVSFP
jgi:hypothetical protein